MDYDFHEESLDSAPLKLTMNLESPPDMDWGVPEEPLLELEDLELDRLYDRHGDLRVPNYDDAPKYEDDDAPNGPLDSNPVVHVGN